MRIMPGHLLNDRLLRAHLGSTGNRPVAGLKPLAFLNLPWAEDLGLFFQKVTFFRYSP